MPFSRNLFRNETSQGKITDTKNTILLMTMNNNHCKPSEQTHQAAANLPSATPFRILAAWIYDFMLLCAVWLLAGVIYIIPAQMFLGIDSSSNESLSTTEFTGPVFYIYLFIVTWIFFAWFWTHGGQTLGLRTWSLRLQTHDGYAINWMQSLLRFLVAGAPWLLALFLFDQLNKVESMTPPFQYLIFLVGCTGLCWIWIDRKKRSLQDIASGTRIVKLPKKPKKPARQ